MEGGGFPVSSLSGLTAFDSPKSKRWRVFIRGDQGRLLEVSSCTMALSRGALYWRMCPGNVHNHRVNDNTQSNGLVLFPQWRGGGRLPGPQSPSSYHRFVIQIHCRSFPFEPRGSISVSSTGACVEASFSLLPFIFRH